VKNRNPSIKYLFEPRSIAIIGASHNTNKIGYLVVENILLGGYAGRVYPVNPKGGQILGHPVYKSVESIGDSVDVACVAVPAKTVFDAIKSCAEKKIKFVIIISSGFSEVGNISEERRIVSYARAHGMRIVGPNVFGIYSSSVLLNATFGPRDIKPGNVAIVTQSGAIGVAMIGKTKIEDIGLSTIISVGNKSDISEVDLLDYLISHKASKVILMYIEGIEAGEKLVKVLKMTTRKKPVLVIKSGRSKRGALAAASHTGSLAGEDKVFDDIAKQCGVIRAESIQEALDWCKFLANSPTPKGENTVIVTNGGGLGVLAADACEKYSVHLYDDSQNLKKTFSGAMPEFGSAKNPVDLTGEATAEDYDYALGAALRNRNIHSIACLSCETAVFDADEFTRIVEKRYADYKSAKPIVFSLFGGDKVETCMTSLKKSNIPVFPEVYEATSFLGAIYSHYRNRVHPAGTIETANIDTPHIESVINKAREDGRRFLLSHEAQSIIRAAGIPTPRSYIAHNLDEAANCAEGIGYPVVMKVTSKDIIHKSDVGGVALDLENKDEVIDAYEAILHNCRAHRPDALVEGMEVSEMIEPGIETIVGARRDRGFGPIVMFGLGGIYVEILRDISFRAFPLSREEVMNMISEIHSYPLFLGVRGGEKKDIDAMAGTIIKVGTVLQQCKGISDIEINPLVVYDYGEGVKAVDVRILLSES